MVRFLLRRLLIAIPTLLLVVTIAFFMMRAAPGGPFDTNRKLPPEVERNLEAKYGLDQPLGVQYLTYLTRIAHGDLGPSLKYHDRSVLDVIREGFPTSFKLGVSALALGAALGISLGVLGALRQNAPSDHAITALAILGICIPTFVIAPMLVLVFASSLGWLPTGGLTDARGYVLPVIVLALPQTAIISRLTRAGMVEVLRSNYVRTARAKGLPERDIVLRHALRAAILPLVSYLGPAAAGLITGSLVVEKIFTLPGLGKAFVISALQRDYTVVMGVVILYASLVIGLNLLAEVAQALLDPRIRLT
ncbi:MAG TPA: ABC transporter permease subunit [Caulobacteraceae bacterium]|jgi:oligopeptide transport system permease protein|nr:ABC transporter permease subunit [Caulobacteraceae bacterium]